MLSDNECMSFCFYSTNNTENIIYISNKVEKIKFAIKSLPILFTRNSNLYVNWLKHNH